MLFKNRIFGKKSTCTYFPKYYPGVVRSIHLVFKGLQYNNQVLVKSRKVSRRLKLHIQNGTYNAPSNKTRDINKKWPPGISRIIEFSRYRKWHKNHFHTRENMGLSLAKSTREMEVRSNSAMHFFVKLSSLGPIFSQVWKGYSWILPYLLHSSWLIFCLNENIGKARYRLLYFNLTYPR